MAISPTFTLLLDVAALAALVAVGLAGQPPGTAIRRLGSNLACPGLIAIAVTGAVAFAGPGEGEVGRGAVLRPAVLIGARFPLLDRIDVGDRLATGAWLVVLHRHDCPACREALPDYGMLAHRWSMLGHKPRVALVELPPHRTTGGAPHPLLASCTLGRLIDLDGWQVETPAEFWLRDGIVIPPDDMDADRSASGSL